MADVTYGYTLLVTSVYIRNLVSGAQRTRCDPF
jgi:hypothetical protein